jgi:uncharacterized membrane protein
MLNSPRFREEDPNRNREVRAQQMELAQAEASRGFVLVTRRNNSLSPRGRKTVLASLFGVSLAISLPFALHGAWLILPFAGAEMAMLYLAFRAVARHAQDYESISISQDRVLIEQRERGRLDRHELNRYWARVVFEPCVQGRGNVLALRSHGRQIEFGRHLTDEQRRELAQALRQELRHIS